MDSDNASNPTGPLAGIRVVELAGLGPAPYGCMVLADLGADIVRIGRPGGVSGERPFDTLNRGRRNVVLDLKSEDGMSNLRRLVAAADVFVEGFRPGVAERLGLGPEDMTSLNARLVYARMTGWGQDGPLAARAGHDINYASIAGAIGAIGEPGRKPVAPLNLVADFGGGGMFLVAGVLAALVERSSSGRGQVIDVAMVDGTASLLAMTLGFHSAGIWEPRRGSNLLDGGAPYYDTYECADGRYLAVGCLEPQFFAEFVRVLGVADVVQPQGDRSNWPAMRELFRTTIAGKSRDEWASLFEGVDACVSPVLMIDEVVDDPHMRARGSVVSRDGVLQPAPAPRFSRTPGAIGAAPGEGTASIDDVFKAWSC